MSDGYLEKYGLQDENKPHTINYFEEVGWFDPFPQTSFLTNLYDAGEFECDDITENIYPKSRVSDPENMPKSIYIPKREMMFTMMRACVGVESEDDLFFNKF